MILKDKSIVLGITGGIAAYKTVALCSHLIKAGALVDVIMTEAACKFVAPLTFQALTHRPVVVEMFELLAETEIGHVSLAKRADLVIIAPATANTIAKLAAGLADNMLTTTALATEAPMLLAPAMESHMWSNPITQDNVRKLVKLGDVTLIGPGEGRLASGATGTGRMSEPEEIADAANFVLGRNGDLAGRKAVITAGGTRESLDPVRYFGNRSSGQMGYALATAARNRGAEVSLISTTGRPAPFGVKLLEVESAAEMHKAVMELLPRLDVLIMAAAVADYRPTSVAKQKIKKSEGGLNVDLERTADILAQVALQRRPEQVIVGFAAETENLLENAREKLQRKKLDLIIANDAFQAIGAAVNQITLIAAGNDEESLPLMSKSAAADKILDRVSGLFPGDGRQ